MANVQVKSIRRPGFMTTDVDYFGLLALGYNNSSTGATTILGSSEVYLNHYNSLNQSGGDGTSRNLDEAYDVALFAVVKNTEISTAPNYFAVYGATMDNIDGTSTSLTYHRGHITVIQLKA